MRRTLPALLLLAALSAACGGRGGVQVDDDPRAVSTSQLERQVADALEKEVGQRPDSVSCPKPLPAEKGAKVRCTLTAGSDEVGLTVTTTSVSASGQVGFGVEVDDKVAG